MYGKPILDSCSCEHHNRLKQIADQKPESPPRANEVADLSHDPAAEDEECEGNADVFEREDLAGCDATDSYSKEDRVAGLVGREAEVVGVGSSVLEAGGEGEEE